MRQEYRPACAFPWYSAQNTEACVMPASCYISCHLTHKLLQGFCLEWKLSRSSALILPTPLSVSCLLFSVTLSSIAVLSKDKGKGVTKPFFPGVKVGGEVLNPSEMLRTGSTPSGKARSKGSLCSLLPALPLEGDCTVASGLHSQGDLGAVHQPTPASVFSFVE